MRKRAVLLLVGILTLAGAGSATAGEDTCVPNDSGEKDGSLVYRRMMRDLDREYQRGELTRTEYIQRKREIEKDYN